MPSEAERISYGGVASTWLPHTLPLGNGPQAWRWTILTRFALLYICVCLIQSVCAQIGQLDGIQSNLKCNSQMVGYYHAIYCCSDDIRSVIRAIATTRNQFLSDYTRYRYCL